MQTRALFQALWYGTSQRQASYEAWSYAWVTDRAFLGTLYLG